MADINLDIVVLNAFRNKYYTDGNDTENGIIANALDSILPEFVRLRKKDLPEKPIMLALDGFDAEDASALSCPNCHNPVTNYWVRGAKPKHCQFCGQKIDWSDNK